MEKIHYTPQERFEHHTKEYQKAMKAGETNKAMGHMAGMQKATRDFGKQARFAKSVGKMDTDQFNAIKKKAK